MSTVRVLVSDPDGSRGVSATLTDYTPAKAEAKVKLDSPTSVTVKLDEIIYYGTIVITTKPEAGVAVFLDDKYIGTTPLAEPQKVQANREHVVRLELKGFDTWTRAVVVAPDKPSPVEATLEAPTPAGPADDSW